MTSILFGRATTSISIAGTVALFGLSYGGPRADLRAETVETVLYALAAIAVCSAFASWSTAVVHVRRRLRGGQASLQRWHAIVILGAFVGAWAYWWFGADSVRT